MMRIDGKEIANKILLELKNRVETLKEKLFPADRNGIAPHLAIILVDKNPASLAYVNQKKLKGKIIGAKITVKRISQNITQAKLLKTIKQLNNDSNIHGIIVQRPLPPSINTNEISLAINLNKDVDGFHPNSKFQPPITLAVLRILEEVYWKKSEARNPKHETNSNVQNTNFQNKFLSFGHLNFDIVSSFDIRYSNFVSWLSSQKIVIIGKGETGGRPIIDILRKMGVQPIVIDSKTSNPQKLTKKADIIISAVGKENVVSKEMLKKGVILIGVGLYKGRSGKMQGDYDEEKIKNIASFYTPTPGGVGPINVAMLLQNLVSATETLSKLVKL